ncbi:efflux RND transporter periplasmic adaptor subunit [Sphingomonas sp.]|uniref:efflux RND transporter periplasmic adaptor subunit n=1 Tax=Sphingomonas sp. TaxID=28214 RepID=UPI0025DD509E|nr:efflux RND transporter periplasmic adaptor subunit [Sphingomonas sp.]MBV9529457.1 efflux RND transporter periplasmic adaptor subunit [Sphingomonas sp.]
MNMETRVESGSGQGLGNRVAGLSRNQKIALGAAPLALLAGVILWEGNGAPAPAAPPPPVVTVATPLVRQVAEWDDYSGRFEASKSVEVRPRVSGAITGVYFTDGTVVRQGQLLFTIDQRPYRAALAQAQAAVASARSDLTLAQANLGRATRLLAVDAVSRSDVDQLRAKVQASQAELAAANAQVQARALDLSFTQVRAPIGGRISDRRIDPGNLVQGGGSGADGSLLTTINALDPIYFTFDASEALFLKARRAKETGAAPSDVQIRLQDETDYRWHGRLDFADNGLDTRSGTIRLRAIVSNGTQFLTPGMFGNMRLSDGVPERALLVPDAAVSTDQARKIVMVAAKDGSLTPHPVMVGPVIDGLRVIRSGLAPTDQVVIAGAQLVMPGMKAKLQPGKITAVAAATAQPDTVSAPLSGQATFASR